MINVILILIVAVIAFFAIRFTVKRMQRKAGCCGSGGQNSVMVEPKHIEKILGKKEIIIDGMKCKNCSAKVQNALNSLENVNASVSFKKKTAKVKFGQGVTDELLKTTVEGCGYKILEIR